MDDAADHSRRAGPAMARGGHHTTCGAIGRTAGWSRGAGARVREEGVGRVIHGAQRSNQGLGSPPWRQACNSVRRVCDSAGRGYGWFRCELSWRLHSCTVCARRAQFPFAITWSLSCRAVHYRIAGERSCVLRLSTWSLMVTLSRTNAGGLSAHMHVSPRDPGLILRCVCAPSPRSSCTLVPFLLASSRSNVFSVVGCFYWT